MSEQSRPEARAGTRPEDLAAPMSSPDALGDSAAAVPEADPALDFDTWAAASGPALHRFAQVITGNAHDAADAVQDALVAIYPRWRKVSERGGPDAYARRIIVNRRISWWRRIGRRESAELPSDAAAPDTQDATDAAVARDLLTTLPVRQRAAVVLRFYDDLSFAEIARILDCTESTARSYVHRALGRLRQTLDSRQLGADDV